MVFDKDFIRFFKALQLGVSRVAYQASLGLSGFRYVAAVDAAYSGSRVAAASLVYDVEEDGVVEERRYVAEARFPYVPGLLFLREGPYMLRAVELLQHRWDLLLVDAHGRAHPRRAGMATFLGLCVNRPTLGVAKRLLEGRIADPEKEVSEIVSGDGEVLGYAFRAKNGRRFYVSQGYGVGLGEIPGVVERLGGYPKALTLVDRLSKRTLKAP